MSHRNYNYNNSFSQEKAPHEPIVSALIALRVVSIVFLGLFGHTWFEAIIVLILFISLIKNVIEYLQNAEIRRNYRYNTQINEVAGIWIALIVVSIIMQVFLGKVWYAQIAPAILQIKAVEITILYLVTLTQNNRNKRELSQNSDYAYNAYGHPAQSSVNYNQVATASDSEYALYTIRVKNEEEQKSDENLRYCPICGEKAESNAKFCPYCGTNLDR
ncbi:MAG: zinc ribbon domain-containing protein [Promethearchaeota archaeon]